MLNILAESLTIVTLDSLLICTDVIICFVKFLPSAACNSQFYHQLHIAGESVSFYESSQHCFSRSRKPRFKFDQVVNCSVSGFAKAEDQVIEWHSPVHLEFTSLQSSYFLVFFIPKIVNISLHNMEKQKTPLFCISEA